MPGATRPHSQPRFPGRSGCEISFSCMKVNLSGGTKLMESFQALELDTVHLFLNSWWDDVNKSKDWQEWTLIALAATYAAISLWALIQLIRIERRVPEYGWTIQKLFHVLNFVVNGVRALIFFFWHRVLKLPLILRSVLLDLPGLLFFTTYTLLILFWAEIYYQARNIPADNFRTIFILLNSGVYVVQAILWFISWWAPEIGLKILSSVFFSAISSIAAIGFLIHGGRLFHMLRRFPVDSKGRERKMREVGTVTGICTICFALRSFFVAFSSLSKGGRIDILEHPLMNAIYYAIVEIFPSALVLFILRKLPPKRVQHPVLTCSMETAV